MIGPARVAAFRVLREVARGEAQPAAVLAREHRTLSDPRDRALATEIVIGTLRWQRALDASIAAAAARPLDGIDAGVLLVLRLSLYQLLHLSRVPASAVLSKGGETYVWAVDLPGSTVSLHKVDLAMDGMGARVSGGLAAGTRIVTAGVHSLKPGQKVRIEKDATP